MKYEGFWKGRYNDHDKPMPVAHSEPFPEQAKFLDDLARVEHGSARMVHYRGWSTCRICHKPNGSGEYTSKGWTWPEGFRHYVEAHNVIPTPEFAEFIEDEA